MRRTSPTLPSTGPDRTAPFRAGCGPAPGLGPRIGTLTFHPGGPGLSGVDAVFDDRYFNPEILRRFDIVDFDPRGVGRSNPAVCSAELPARRPQPVPASKRDYDDLVTFSRTLDEDCRQRTGPLAPAPGGQPPRPPVQPLPDLAFRQDWELGIRSFRDFSRLIERAGAVAPHLRVSAAGAESFSFCLGRTGKVANPQHRLDVDLRRPPSSW